MFNKRILWLALTAIAMLTACSQAAEPTQQATETPLPPPFGVTYCDIDPVKICLEGFGLDIEENLLVLFKVFDQAFEDIYIRADGPEGEIFFRCQHSDNFTENVYCLGEPYPEGELIKLYIHDKSNNKLTAIGVFQVSFSDLPEPDFVFEPETTPTPSSVVTSSPTPSTLTPTAPTPSYPNPEYPNPVGQ